MQVAYQCKQVFVLITKKGFVASLKEMPHRSVFLIEISGIGKIEELHDARNRGLLRFNEKVNMVDHKDISIKSEVALFFVMLQAVQILKPVLIIVKDVLFPVPSDNDMIKSAGELYTRWSCHKKRIAYDQPNCNFASLTLNTKY